MAQTVDAGRDVHSTASFASDVLRVTMSVSNSRRRWERLAVCVEKERNQGLESDCNRRFKNEPHAPSGRLPFSDFICWMKYNIDTHKSDAYNTHALVYGCMCYSWNKSWWYCLGGTSEPSSHVKHTCFWWMHRSNTPISNSSSSWGFLFSLIFCQTVTWKEWMTLQVTTSRHAFYIYTSFSSYEKKLLLLCVTCVHKHNQ